MNFIADLNKISFIVVLGSFLFFFFFFAKGWSGAVLELKGDKISVEADQVPLRQLLYKLQKQGVAIHVDPSINPIVSAYFSDQPAERVLASILRGYDHSIIWKKIDVRGEENIQLVELRIFEQGLEHKTVPLESGKNLAVEQDSVFPHVKNRLLIRLAQGVEITALESRLARFGAFIAEPVNQFGVIRVWLPDSVSPGEAADVLSEADMIAAAEPDYAYRLTDNDIPFISEGNVTQDQHERDSNFPVVAVLDSGLAERFGDESFVSSVYDAVAGTPAASDGVGHGTQMSLIAAGLLQPLGAAVDSNDSPSIVAVRAFDDEGFTSNYTLMNAMEYALDSGAQIISLSWGTEQPSGMLESIVDYATSRDAILIAAAGNDPTGKPVYPAAYDEVIGVGALNPDGSVWPRSNYGKSASVWAPGFVIADGETSNEKKIYAGTSVATAYLANRIAAILKEDPAIDAASMARRLVEEGRIRP